MSDPKRLLDPGSKTTPALRGLLEAARSDLPEEERVRSLGERLAPWLLPAAGGAGSGAVATGLAVARGAKLGVVAVLALGTAAGTTYVAVHRSGPAPASPSTTAPGIPRPPAPPLPPPAPGPPAPPIEPAEAPEPSSAPRSSTPIARDGETEIALLEAGQQLLSSDPAAALARAERHAALYPHGALAQEREVIAIEALVGLRRVDAARRRARRFEADYPGSAHRARIESLLDETSIHNP